LSNWNKFLKEEKEKSIDSLRYPKLTSKKHKKRLKEKPSIIKIDAEDIPELRFPKNSSKITKSEIRSVMYSMVSKDRMSDDLLHETDKNPIEMFFKFLDKNKVKYDEDFMNKIYKDVAIIVIKLKAKYSRPRPEVLGPKLGFDIASIKTDTDNTPAFPSGHTSQAWTMALFLSDQYPELKSGFHKIASQIEQSRIDRGAHYPSDNRIARHLAKKYLYPNLDKSNYLK
jgi:hypothetical protein